MRKLLSTPEAITVALLIIAFFVGIAESKYFLDPFYLLDQTAMNAEAGMLVLGMTLVIVCGEIDLSVASNLALSGCIVAKLIAAGLPAPVAILAGIAIGAVLGGFNGVLVAYANLPSFLVSLGTWALYRGIAQALMGAESTMLPKSYGGIDAKFIPGTGIPIPLGILLLLAAAISLLLHRSVFGRWIFAIGSNDQAARYSAVPYQRVKLLVFIISGALAGGGGALMDSRLGVARYDLAQGLELTVITATVLGGASIYGGRGTIAGSVLALMLMVIISSGLGLANVPADYQLAIIGTILVVAVGLNAISKRFAAR
jgi:rhamnose transport system permease protein